MVRLRGVSTVIGTLISIAAIVTVLAAAAYMMESMANVQVNAARLTAARMNEWLEAYSSTKVTHLDGYICFNDTDDPGLIRAVIVAHGRHVHVHHGRCLTDADVPPGSRLILVTRSGAMIPLDADQVLSLNGTTLLPQLFTQSSTTPLAASQPSLSGVLGVLYKLASEEPTRLVVRAKLYEYEWWRRFDKLYITTLIELRSRYTLVYAPPPNLQRLLARYVGAGALSYDASSYARFDQWLRSPWIGHAIYVNFPILPYYIGLVDNNTVCGVVLNQPYSAVVCVKRLVLNGPVTINGTLIWFDSRLGKLLVDTVSRYGNALVYVGPAGGYIVFIPPGKLVKMEPGVNYKPVAEGNIIHFAPILYTVGSDPGLSTPATRLKPLGVTPLSLRPYLWMVWTPLAYYYTVATGQEPWMIVASPRADVAMQVYVEGFFTYVEPAPGTSCRVVRVSQLAPPVIEGHLAYYPGLVCIKVGSYNATVHILTNIYGGKLLRLEAPGDLVACYYPAVLQCNGPVYIYYSFAPSVLYEDSHVYDVIKLVLDNMYWHVWYMVTPKQEETYKYYAWAEQYVPISNPWGIYSTLDLLAKTRIGVYHYTFTRTPAPGGTCDAADVFTQTLYHGYYNVEPPRAQGLPGVTVAIIDTVGYVEVPWAPPIKLGVIDFNVTIGGALIPTTSSQVNGPIAS